MPEHDCEAIVEFIQTQELRASHPTSSCRPNASLMSARLGAMGIPYGARTACAEKSRLASSKADCNIARLLTECNRCLRAIAAPASVTCYLPRVTFPRHSGFRKSWPRSERRSLQSRIYTSHRILHSILPMQTHLPSETSSYSERQALEVALVNDLAIALRAAFLLH
jgi:hypothetical protein